MPDSITASLLQVLRAATAVRLVLCIGLGWSAVTASAMDGVFDRSGEVAGYMQAIKSGTRGAVINASREIFDAGISDRMLGDALQERLLADFKNTTAMETTATQYVGWMIKALASTGIADYDATLARVQRESSDRGIRQYCIDQRAQIDWYRKRNELMASRKHHSEGDDPRVSRLLNLLDEGDFSFKLYVADRMDWARILDSRLTDAVEREVLVNIDSTVHGVSRDQAKAMGMFIKLLGYSGNTKYRATMERVKSSKATSLMKKYADESLKRLQN